jgi:uncharacterized protein
MIDFEKLWHHVINDPDLRKSNIHGPHHWARVERNGLYIGKQVDADLEVIKLFALFHDSKRQNDSIDPGHGKRGAQYAKILRNKLFEISDEQFNLFFNTCRLHTRQIHTKDITMGVCWDADRLDLGRIGMKPSSKFLNTDIAKDIANKHRWDLLEALPARKIKDSSLRSE